MNDAENQKSNNKRHAVIKHPAHFVPCIYVSLLLDATMSLPLELSLTPSLQSALAAAEAPAWASEAAAQARYVDAHFAGLLAPREVQRMRVALRRLLAQAPLVRASSSATAGVATSSSAPPAAASDDAAVAAPAPVGVDSSVATTTPPGGVTRAAFDAAIAAFDAELTTLIDANDAVLNRISDARRASSQ
jgi:hypothetical protein